MKTFIKTCFVFFLSVNYSQAATFGFGCITNNSGGCGSLESLFTLDVEDRGADTFLQFNVASGDNAAIKSIFFDDSLNLLNPASYLYDESGGTDAGGYVDFQAIDAPGGNFPAGNNISFTSNFSAAAKPPSGDDKNGVDNGEWFGITFFGTDSSLIVSALGLGDLRIGIHIGSVGAGTDYSESLTTTVIPIPAAAWLFGSALLGFFGFAANRKQLKSAA